MATDRPLTPKQTAFVAEYLIDLNATAAARRAGYSERTADRIGPELLGKTCVAEAIQAAMRARAERTELTQDWTIERLRIEALRVDDSASHSARVAALKLLGMHLGMFGAKSAPSGMPELPGGLPDADRLTILRNLVAAFSARCSAAGPDQSAPAHGPVLG